jgi:hypothetical protein
MGYVISSLKPLAKYVISVSVLLILYCNMIILDWQFKFAKL